MSALDADALLCRRGDLRLTVGSDNRVRVEIEEGALELGPHGLAVLDVFHEPLTLAAALRRLEGRVRGARDWQDLTATIVGLHRAGVLVAEGDEPPRLRPAVRGFDAARVHVAMLNDRARTGAFLAAVAETVRPGDRVLDIGSGTGVLAMAAARAGARRVWAVEASGIWRFAREIIADNEHADRITLLPGWSTRIELPERADVLVTEIVGDEPLGERLLEVVRDAQKRLLVPGARLIPRRVEIFALPVDLPPAVRDRQVLNAAGVARWREWYGLRFDALLGEGSEAPSLFFTSPRRAREWPPLGPPVRLASLDLEGGDEHLVDRTATARMEVDGRLGGLVVFAELALGATTGLTTDPHRAAPESHWRNLVWALAEPLAVRAGDEIELGYRYRVTGAPWGELRVERR